MYKPDLHFHFTGIGGSGMSGIAEILLNLGFKVSGTDLSRSEGCKRLEGLGAIIAIGHAAEHVPSTTSALVYSSAVAQDNVELEEAKRRGIPVIRRAEVLAELMRLKFGVAVAGSHGKTTTTSMTGAILEYGGLDPTVIIGGIVKAHGTGGRFGRGEYLVAESDESDRSFLLLTPTIAVVTNIDNEHLSAYQSLSDLESSFQQFIEQVPFYGLAVLCVDDKKVRDLAQSYGRRKVTYGFSPDADIRAEKLEHEPGLTRYEVSAFGEALGAVQLPLPGRHFVLNSLAAIAVGLEFGIPIATIKSALAEFPGVARRLEVVGVESGITVINDYAHHPTEVKATLKGLRDGWSAQMGRMHVVFQPHRYSRTRDSYIDFLDAFDGCDNLIVTAIHAAGEAPIDGVSAASLCESIRHPERKYIDQLEDVIPALVPELAEGDLVVCLGAGSIGSLPLKFVQAISKRAAA